MTAIIKRVIAVLLVMCMLCSCALAEQAYKLSAINAYAESGQLDMIIYSDAPVRTDTVSIRIDDRPLSVLRTLPAAEAGFGCSYLVIVDMPKLKYAEHEDKLLRAYKETLSFLIGSMRDSDNAALLISGQNAAEIQFQDRAAFFESVQALAYTHSPDTLNLSVANGLNHLLEDSSQSSGRSAVIVLTDAQKKSAEGMPTEELETLIGAANICLYMVETKTSYTDKEQSEELERIARACRTGLYLSCARDADENERKLMQIAFSDNEARFYQISASMDGFTKEDPIQTLDIFVSADGKAASEGYTVMEELRTVIIDALPEKEAAEAAADISGNNMTLYVVIGAGALCIAILIALLAASAKKRQQKTKKQEKVCRVSLQITGPDGERAMEDDMPPVLLFGRDSSRVHIAVSEDKKVSAVHCRITFDGVTLRLEDCKSTNGTKLNGYAVSVPCVLHQGDEIAMGNTKIRIMWHQIER